MFLNLFCICCFLQPIINYYSVCSKRAPLERFLVEEGSKPAIFGSYSYDPIKQVFETEPQESNATDPTEHNIPDQIYNETYIHSTVHNSEIHTTDSDHPGFNETTPERHLIFRKQVDTSETTSSWRFRKSSSKQMTTNYNKTSNKVNEIGTKV